MLYNIRPIQVAPIPWGWKNKQVGDVVSVVEHPMKIPDITLEDYFDWDRYEIQKSVVPWGEFGLPDSALVTTDMKCIFNTYWRLFGQEAFEMMDSYALKHVGAILGAWNDKFMEMFGGSIKLFVIGDDVADNIGMIMDPMSWWDNIGKIYSYWLTMIVGNTPVMFHSDGDISKILPFFGERTLLPVKYILFERVGNMRAFHHGDMYNGIRMIEIRHFDLGDNPGYKREVDEDIIS